MHSAPRETPNLTKSTEKTVSQPSSLNIQPTLSLSDVNPTDVQRVIVEHIVRSEEAKSFTHAPRLRAFSGRSPRPNNEVDFDTWRSNVELLMSEPGMSDFQCTRRIMDSLLSPAADLTKHLSSRASAADYLQLLDSAYGTVEDGVELFAKFMTTLQDNGEKPSSYLQRLQVTLSMALRRGGVPAEDLEPNPTFVL